MRPDLDLDLDEGVVRHYGNPEVQAEVLRFARGR